jgi:hypothetical protein
MTVKVADAHAHVKKLVSIVKMATVVEEYTTENLRSFVRSFFVDKRTQRKDIHKEMFPVYGGKCLSGKSVPPW